MYVDVRTVSRSQEQHEHRRSLPPRYSTVPATSAPREALLRRHACWSRTKARRVVLCFRLTFHVVGGWTAIVTEPRLMDELNLLNERLGVGGCNQQIARPAIFHRADAAAGMQRMYSCHYAVAQELCLHKHRSPDVSDESFRAELGQWGYGQRAPCELAASQCPRHQAVTRGYLVDPTMIAVPVSPFRRDGGGGGTQSGTRRCISRAASSPPAKAIISMVSSIVSPMERE